jgi:hypothetical protein
MRGGDGEAEMNLEELLSRIETARGSDREIDSDLMRLYLGGVKPKRKFFASWFAPSEFVLPFTRDLQCAVDVAEKMLPGWGWSAGRPLGNVGFWSSVWRDGLHVSDDGEIYTNSPASNRPFRKTYKPTAALALLAATIRASLTAKGASDE